MGTPTLDDVRSYWNDKRTKIFTETTINVDETFKGQPLPSLSLIQLGGTVGTTKVTVAGALTWSVGEEVLLFVASNTRGQYHVSGFSQGKFNIARDRETGRAYVTRGVLRGAEVLGAEGRDGTAPATAAMREPLDQFIDDALNRR